MRVEPSIEQSLCVHSVFDSIVPQLIDCSITLILLCLVDENLLKKAVPTANQNAQTAWGSPPCSAQYFESAYRRMLFTSRTVRYSRDL